MDGDEWEMNSGRRIMKKALPANGKNAKDARGLCVFIFSPAGFPLRIEIEKAVEKQIEFNADFLKNMFAKIEWKALVDASRTMGYVELPEEVEPSRLDSEDFLRKFHHTLLELHLEEGALVCPETSRRFPVSKGIPNMLLHEDEV